MVTSARFGVWIACARAARASSIRRPSGRRMRTDGSPRSARSTISSAHQSSAATIGCCRSVPVCARSATPRRSTSRWDLAAAPMSITALIAGSPMATDSAAVAPSPWPTIPVRRRSRPPCERMAASMSRASSMRVKSETASQSPSEAAEPRGSQRSEATPRWPPGHRLGGQGGPVAAVGSGANQRGWRPRSQFPSRLRGSQEGSSSALG